MSTQSAEPHDDTISEQISQLADDTIESCVTVQPKDSRFHRCQDDRYEGNGVFFNHDGSKSRYGIPDGSKGALYISEDTVTCLAETFKDEEFIANSDLDKFHMATLKTQMPLHIVDLGRLAPKMKLTTHQLTDDKYTVTQQLASKLASAGVDGLSYVSNRTQKNCIVLWNEKSDGQGTITTEKLEPLRGFTFEGRSATEMLEKDLCITVVP